MQWQSSTNCEHLQVNHKFCIYCSSYVYPQIKVYGVKHLSLNRAGIQAEEIIDGLRLRAVDLTHNKDFNKLQQSLKQIFQQISSLCSQLNTSYQVKILSMYIAIHCHENIKQVNLMVLVGIFISIKLLQPKVLKNHELHSYFKLSIHQELQKSLIRQSLLCFQSKILKMLDYKINLVTFIDFLEFYVVAGIVTNFQKKADYAKIMNFIDTEIQHYVSSGNIFKEPNQQYLALKILYEARSSCNNIDQIWNIHLENITKVKKIFVQNLIQQKNVLKILNGTNVPFKRKKQNSLYEKK